MQSQCAVHPPHLLVPVLAPAAGRIVLAVLRLLLHTTTMHARVHTGQLRMAAGAGLACALLQQALQQQRHEGQEHLLKVLCMLCAARSRTSCPACCLTRLIASKSLR